MRTLLLSAVAAPPGLATARSSQGYHEFGARNRVEGNGVFLTFSVPLSTRPSRNESEDWTQAEEAQQ